MARRRRGRSLFSLMRGHQSRSASTPTMDKATRRYFRAVFTLLFILFGGMILGQMTVKEIIPNYQDKQYTDIASLSMFIVSFFVAMVAWQGGRALNVIGWVLLRLITFSLGNAAAPTTKIMPPNAWKMIPYSAVVCAIYGAVVGFFNAEIPLATTAFDFGIAGAGWGVALNVLAHLRLLPYADYRQILEDMALEEQMEFKGD